METMLVLATPQLRLLLLLLFLLPPACFPAPLGACKLKIMAMRNKISSVMDASAMRFVSLYL